MIIANWLHRFFIVVVLYSSLWMDLKINSLHRPAICYKYKLNSQQQCAKKKTNSLTWHYAVQYICTNEMNDTEMNGWKRIIYGLNFNGKHYNGHGVHKTIDICILVFTSALTIFILHRIKITVHTSWNGELLTRRTNGILCCTMSKAQKR